MTLPKRLLFSQFNHEIDDMFSIFDSKYCINNISGRLEFIKNWGQQVNQGNFDKAVRFIYSILEDKDDTNIIGVGAALVVLSKRLKPNQVMVDCKINPNAVRTKKDQLPLKWCLPQT
ncbi:hypothetical protein, partial [Levilactobacillus brevis]|uniref:hypothetical protein n=1 Tax=Levilactobacillus brevis TaxID=1580 RepID=UPI0021A8D520